MRHRLPQAPETVRELAEKGLTVEEIASFLNCHESTVYRNFGESLREGRIIRNSKVREKQLEVALSGNPSMLIWLGKQWLDQKDKSELTGNVKHEHLDLSNIPDDKLREIASLVESATGSLARPQE